MGFVPPKGSSLPLEDGRARCFLGPFVEYVQHGVATVESLTSAELDDLQTHLRAHNQTCDDPAPRCPICQWYTFLDEHPPEEWISFENAR